VNIANYCNSDYTRHRAFLIYSKNIQAIHLLTN